MELIPASFLFTILPGIYLATKKYYLIPFNKKCNNFLIRMLFTIPASVGLIHIVSIPILSLAVIFFQKIISFEYIWAGSIILSSFLFVYIHHKYFFRKDHPPEYDPNFMNYELYIFMPFQKTVRTGYNKFSLPPKINYEKDFVTAIQINDLQLNNKFFQNKDLLFTDGGEIVVSENALLLFAEYGFNVFFETRPVYAVKGKSLKPYDLKVSYFQLLPKFNMPTLDSKTSIRQVVEWFSLRCYAIDDQFYYNRQVMENIPDFNLTSESFGAYDADPYIPQKLWVVTNKAMKFLLAEFGHNERDFIPIMLVDDEKDN